MSATHKIRDSVVVITGASSGIGRATALRFAKAGADLVLAARREPALQEVAAQCRKHGVRALVVPADVTDSEAVEALADAAVEAFGRIDVWVNNAAVSLFGALNSTPLEDFRRVLDVNIMGYVHGSRAAVKHFRRQKTGVLINVSSVVGEVPQPFTASYSISKAGINALSASVRSELFLEKLQDVHVVTVLPPTVDTPLFDEVANYTGRRVVPMPPVYSPQRVAATILKGAKKPQHEMPVGQVARQMLRQHRISPATAEKMMAKQVDKKHLSRTEPSRANAGNLYEPAPYKSADVQGGWDGRKRQAARRLLTLAALGGGTLVAVPVAIKAGKATLAVAATQASRKLSANAGKKALSKVGGRR
ncbi:SDR family oxidoreductase [Nesterenkonia sandarakina]|uniref:Short-subunit dehydrogenase n=1 Tax=Nesterenkonia sandarakina TaxID=272918 RepID=A0A7Z0J1V0_9MICC|nr:SDR family oxidoreductase [Nesterenkonia sandarakina]NYJ15472.1 short-subunit dehydrogenase [Nesterenkonia sandarakina]